MIIDRVQGEVYDRGTIHVLTISRSVVAGEIDREDSQMSTRFHAWWLASALTIALLLVGGFVIGLETAAAESSVAAGPPTTIVVCSPSPDSGAPATGPETASAASEGQSEEGGFGLCTAAISSDGRAPDPVTTGTCAAGAITIQSHRGFDWVC